MGPFEMVVDIYTQAEEKNMMESAPPELKQVPLKRAVQCIHDAFKNLDDLLSKLEGRIQPVLSPPEPPRPGDPKAEASVGDSQVVQEMVSIRRRLDDAAERVQGFIRRVEV